MTTVQLPELETLLLEAIRGLAIEYGQVTSPAAAGGNVLSDSTKAWLANVHVNRLVKITKGQGAGQSALIQGNSMDSLLIRGGWLQPIAPGASYMILSMDITQAVVAALGGGGLIGLLPLEQAVVHNVGYLAAVDILGADLTPLNTPCLFRLTACFDAAGILSVETINAAGGGGAQVQQFNGGVALNNNSLYMFEHLVHAGDTINYQYSVNATIMTFRVQEIIGAT